MSPICTQINKEKKYLYTSFGVLALLAVVYMYCVSATVMHVVERKEMTRAISDLNSQVSQLEAEYIAAQHNISAQVASQSGFVETTEKIFIERTDTTLVVRDRLLP